MREVVCMECIVGVCRNAGNGCCVEEVCMECIVGVWCVVSGKLCVCIYIYIHTNIYVHVNWNSVV